MLSAARMVDHVSRFITKNMPQMLAKVAHAAPVNPLTTCGDWGDYVGMAKERLPPAQWSPREL